MTWIILIQVLNDCTCENPFLQPVTSSNLSKWPIIWRKKLIKCLSLTFPHIWALLRWSLTGWQFIHPWCSAHGTIALDSILSKNWMNVLDAVYDCVHSFVASVSLLWMFTENLYKTYRHLHNTVYGVYPLNHSLTDTVITLLDAIE